MIFHITNIMIKSYWNNTTKLGKVIMLPLVIYGFIVTGLVDLIIAFIELLWKD